MTDREQTRQDAERFIEYAAEVTRQKPDTAFARRCLALLAELEQAERAVGKLLQRAEQAERERDEALTWWKQAAGNSADANARLAKVPALVEALRGMVEPDPHTDGYANLEAAHAALAAWEEKR